MRKLKLITIILSSLFIILFFFSFWLMFATFSYKDGQILIAQKAWSDFSAHIPLIRSFSFGANFPPEHPLFPGEPIRYHFLFYLLVGLLEKAGLPLDWAFNLPSALSFFALLVMIYILAKKLFEKTSVAILSVIFFLFNGSFSFLEFFKTHPLSWGTPRQIWENSQFPSFGPYDGKVVSAFWNLNIYTNQRHLALSFAVVLGIISLFYSRRSQNNWKISSLLAGFLTGFLLLINQAAFGITVIFITWFLLLNLKKIPSFALGLVSFLPWFFLFFMTTKLSPYLAFNPGYLITGPLTVWSFLKYWFYNLGLYTLLIPLGFILAKKSQKNLIIPLLALFILPNLFQFSQDIINNHKFFNFFLLVGSMYVGNLLVSLWRGNSSGAAYIKKFGCVVLLVFLTFSGIIDFMVIKNDVKIRLTDAPISKDIQFFIKSVDKHAIVLNSTFLYHPASLAGRPIFFGYSYFPWSYGYKTAEREEILLRIFRSRTQNEACTFLRQNKISYVELSTHAEEFIRPNWELWEKDFSPIYKNPNSGIALYDVSASCR